MGRAVRGPRRGISPATLPLMAADMTIAQFQSLIKERYFETDAARGVSPTFVWLAEEFGELAEAIGRHERGDGDLKALGSEFADVLAWLATLANITGVNLTDAIARKYIEGGGPEGIK